MKGDLCKDCFNNTSEFPKVLCKHAPYNEVIYCDSCTDYKKVIPNQIFIFFGFGERGNRVSEEYEWNDRTKAISGLQRNGKRPTIASLLGKQITDKENAQDALNFAIRTVQYKSKINLSTEIAEILNGKV